MKRIIMALLASGTLAVSTYAGIIINANEVGSDVVISYAGSINTSSLTLGLRGPYDAHGVNGNYNTLGGVFNFGTSAIEWLANDNLQTFGAIGTKYTAADTYEGDDFGINHNGLETIRLPENYVSGSEISGSLTFNDATLESLGIYEGVNTATWSFGSGANADSITFSAAVPEPATVGLLGISAGVLWLFRRRFSS